MLIAVIILFILMFASGVALTRTGRPYNKAILTLHKLFSVGAIVVTIIFFLGQDTEIVPMYLYILGGLVVLAELASGGILSLEKAAYLPVLMAHRVFALLTLAAAGYIYYLI